MQIEGLHFGSARAVVVPTDLSGTRRSMLDVLAAVIACAVTSDPAPELVVAGHTDRSGSAAANLVLSEARARNVELLLRADKTGWATHTFSHYAVEDLQLVYGWAAARQLWPCDPGPVDNELGPRTKAARRAFREAYNHEMAGAIPLDEEIGVADFEALFELYVDELGLLLSDLGDVGTLSAALRFAAPAVLPCGEAWPCNAVTLDGYEAGGDRRIDILLFDPDELPDLGAVPIGVDVYGRHKYRSEALPDRSAIRLVRLQLRDHRGVPRVGCEYEVTDVRGAHVGATDAHGFTERFLADSGDIAGVLVEGSRYRILVSDQPSDALRSAQTILNALGFDAGALGQSDRRTRAAIRNFQWVEGLFITGELDDPTSAALQNAAWRRHGGS